jgi:hypothetical protein
MRSFSYQIILFFAIPAVLFGTVFYINWNNFLDTPPNINKRTNFICGDSHLETSINPDQLQNYTSIAQASEPFFLTYWKLKYLLNYVEVDTILLAYTHHSISAFNDVKLKHHFWSKEMFKRSYFIGDIFFIEKQLPINYKALLQTYFEKTCIYPHNNHHSFMGSFNKLDTCVSLSVDYAINRHYYDDNQEVYKTSTIMFYYLNQIIELCKTNNIQLILIGSPVHPSYYAKIPPQIMKDYNDFKNIANQKNIPIWDLSNMHFNDSCFYNADHLNYSGAKIFTSYIAKKLNSYH